MKKRERERKKERERERERDIEREKENALSPPLSRSFFFSLCVALEDTH